MSGSPFDNSVLTAVYGPGAVDDYGKNTGDGPALWSGRMGAYLHRAWKSESLNGQYGRREIDELVVRGHLPIELVIGAQAMASRLEIVDNRDTPVIRTFRAVSIQKTAIGSPVDSVRIELADERA